MAKVPTSFFQKPTNWLIEGVALLLATPFLLFPTVSRPATALAVLLFSALTITSILRFKTPVWKSSPLTIPIALITLGATIGTLVSADRDLTLPKIAGIILGLLWYRYLTIHAHYTQTATILILIGFGFTIMGFLTADWSLIKIPGLSPLLARILPSQATAINRGAGVHLNQLGGTLLLFAPLVWSHTLFRAPFPLFPFPFSFKNRSLILLTLTSLALIAITQSRSGWVGVAAVFLIFAVIVGTRLTVSRDRSQINIILAAIVGIFSLAVVALSLGILSRFAGTDTAVGSLDSLGFRAELWQWSRTAIRDYPITGTGLGTFRRVAPRLYPLSFPSTYDIAHAHNQFLQVWLDTGIIGIIGYVGTLITALQIIRSRWETADLRPYLLGAILCLFGFHIFGLTDALALGAKPHLLYWMILGLVSQCVSQ